MIKALENKNLSTEEYIYTLNKIIENVQNGSKLVGLCEEMGNRLVIDNINSHPINTGDLKARNPDLQPCPMDKRVHDGKEHKSFTGCFYYCKYKDYIELPKDKQIELVENLINHIKKKQNSN
ncbi:MAG: hypothetical protein ACRCW0_07745 [Clostridium sp.]